MVVWLRTAIEIGASSRDRRKRSVELIVLAIQPMFSAGKTAIRKSSLVAQFASFPGETWIFKVVEKIYSV
ncbi:hypothetical protein VB739_01735 [Cyanobium gracile UHCC 0281]|uniref:Transposase n=1 Tax=Cyanobium gracile UHCC 0281 TaxID=3110309 RepID=A0ABU5SRZ6_9CYAN|nr:hypothetical protein [Cyanobium gracile UHCC 0281]